MKKILFILTLTFFLAKNSNAASVIKLSQIADTLDQHIGAEVLKEAYSKIGISIEIALLPGERALKESSEGRTDGEVYRIFEVGETYPTLIRVPTPIYYIEPSVFSRKYDFTVTDCSALNNYTLGIVRGVKHAELCTQGMSNVQIFPYNKVMLELLDADKIDMVIISKISGLLMVKELNIKTIYPLSPPLSRRYVYHYLHEKNKNLVPKINKVLIGMKKSGELAELREKAIEKLFKHIDNK